MFTFDQQYQAPEDPLKALVQKNLPDEIECGETNLYWVFMRRSTKMIELVSKQTGVIVARCTVDRAETYGLSQAQVSAARAALTL